MSLNGIRLLSFFLCPLLRPFGSSVSKSTVGGTCQNSLGAQFREVTASTCRSMADTDGKRALPSRVTRLLAVEGDGTKTNDVIFMDARASLKGSDENPKFKQHVVFFGGDVQVCINVMW